jgi:hypothetical protein
MNDFVLVEVPPALVTLMASVVAPEASSICSGEELPVRFDHLLCVLA